MPVAAPQIHLPRSQHGNKKQRHPQRRHERKHDREGHIAKNLPGHALDKHDGEKHRHRRQGGGKHGAADFSGASDGGRDHIVAFFAASENALQHHDGIIDQHPNTEREPAQGHDIEGHAKNVHRREGRHDRNGDGQAHDCGMRWVAEKNVQDQNRQPTAQQRGLLDLVHRRFDERGLIGQQFHGHAFGQCKGDKTRHLLHLYELPHLLAPVTGIGPVDFAASELGDVRQLLGRAKEAVAHALRCRHDIGVRLLKNLDLHAFRAIDPGDDLPLFVRAIHLPHVFHANFHAPAAAHHQIGDLVNGAKFIQGPHEVLRLAVQQTAAREVDVFLLQPPVDGVDVQAHHRQLPLADLDANFLFQPAFDAGRGHALEGLQFLLDFLFGDVAQHVHIFFAVNPHAHDRVLRGVVAQNQWPIDPARQIEAVEIFAHGLHRVIHIRIPAELQNHIGQAGPRNRRNAHQIAHHPKALFNRPRDQIFDFFGRGIGIFRPHGQGGIRNIGHHIQRQLLIRHVPEYGDR